MIFASVLQSINFYIVIDSPIFQGEKSFCFSPFLQDSGSIWECPTMGPFWWLLRPKWIWPNWGKSLLLKPWRLEKLAKKGKRPHELTNPTLGNQPLPLASEKQLWCIVALDAGWASVRWLLDHRGFQGMGPYFHPAEAASFRLCSAPLGLSDASGAHSIYYPESITDSDQRGRLFCTVKCSVKGIVIQKLSFSLQPQTAIRGQHQGPWGVYLL